MPVSTWWNYILAAGKFKSVWQENSEGKKILAALEIRGHIQNLLAAVEFTQFTVNFLNTYLRLGIMHDRSLAVGQIAALSHWAPGVSDAAKWLRSFHSEPLRDYEMNMIQIVLGNFILKVSDYFLAAVS